MRQINVSLGQRSYPILIGPGLLGRAAERLSALPVKRWAVVADETAASLYAGELRAAGVYLPRRGGQQVPGGV